MQTLIGKRAPAQRKYKQTPKEELRWSPTLKTPSGNECAVQYEALYPLSLGPCQGSLFFGGLVLGQNGRSSLYKQQDTVFWMWMERWYGPSSHLGGQGSPKHPFTVMCQP